MIYLDNHSTTQCDPQVVDNMMPYYFDTFGNPASNHIMGEKAMEAVTFSKGLVSELIDGKNGRMIFTSGATESNNIVLLGLSRNNNIDRSRRNKIVSIAIEHKSIISPLEQLKSEGWEVEFLPIDDTGMVDLLQAKNIIGPDCFLVTIQLANSEIGTIQPLKHIAEIAHSVGAFVHTDASQALGKINISVEDLRVDFMSLSGHKIYGPKGIGALWIREGMSSQLIKTFLGGGIDGDIRPGTIPVPLVVGFGKACDICAKRIEHEYKETSNLRDEFERTLLNLIPGLKINGNIFSRLPNNSNLSFPFIEAEMLLANLPQIIASTGSACESASIEPSKVLLSISLTREQAFSAIRFGFGRFNTLEQVQIAASQLGKTYHQLLEIIS